MKNLIAFVGRKQSGKDTAALALLQSGFELVKFAGALKDMLRTLFAYAGMQPPEIEARIEGNLKEAPTRILGGMTARQAMQFLGTEWGRDLIDEDLWVNICLARCKEFQNVVIGDCRFPNEADAIHQAGGKIVRIIRGDQTHQPDAHASETLIDGLDTDCEITNNGPIAELHEKVRALVKR